MMLLCALTTIVAQVGANTAGFGAISVESLSGVMEGSGRAPPARGKFLRSRAEPRSVSRGFARNPTGNNSDAQCDTEPGPVKALLFVDDLKDFAGMTMRAIGLVLTLKSLGTQVTVATVTKYRGSDALAKERLAAAGVPLLSIDLRSGARKQNLLRWFNRLGCQHDLALATNYVWNGKPRSAAAEVLPHLRKRCPNTHLAVVADDWNSLKRNISTDEEWDALIPVIDSVVTTTWEDAAARGGEDHRLLRIRPLVMRYGFPNDGFSNEQLPSPVDHSVTQGICFVGGLWVQSNVQALVWFLEHIWPGVSTSLATLGQQQKFHVYGATAPFSTAGKLSPTARGTLPEHRRLQVLFKRGDVKQGRIQLHGTISNLSSAMKGCRVHVTPMNMRSGVSTKVYEALRLGVAFVATSNAMRGYKSARQVAHWSAVTPADFAHWTTVLASNQTMWERATSHAQALISNISDAVRSDGHKLMQLVRSQRTQRTTHAAASGGHGQRRCSPVGAAASAHRDLGSVMVPLKVYAVRNRTDAHSPGHRTSTHRKVALITGITGQDGSYLAELLLDKGYEVHGIRRRASSFNSERLRGLETRLFLHYGDLADSASCMQIVQQVRPHEIYNLAAQSHVKTSFEMSEYTADVDGMGVIRLRS